MMKKIPEISEINDAERGLQYAFRLLGYRARSEAEMRQRMAEKKYSPGVIEKTVARLYQLSMLDDRDFARAFIASRPGKGPAWLRQELFRKGIYRPLAEELITEEISPEKEFADAWKLAQRALQSTERPIERGALLRLRNSLQRRGFSFEVIARVTSRLREEISADDDWPE